MMEEELLKPKSGAEVSILIVLMPS